MFDGIHLIERINTLSRCPPRAELVDGLLEFGATLDALAGGLLAEDHVDAFSAKSAEAVEVLVSAALPCSNRFSAFDFYPD